MSDDLVKRMHNWNRCYPGNLNIECVWEEAIARIEALTAENAKLREALQEQIAFLAMDLTVLRGHADPQKIEDLEYRRDRARAVLAKWGA